jgi:hypothetical protein
VVPRIVTKRMSSGPSQPATRKTSRKGAKAAADDDGLPKSKQEIKRSLWSRLDEQIYRNGLTDLHTHLMGMGSSEFWVSKIIKTYLSEKKGAFLSLKSVMIASGYPVPKGPISDDRGDVENFFSQYYSQISRFESRFFEGFEGVEGFKFETLFERTQDDSSAHDPLNTERRQMLVSKLFEMLEYENNGQRVKDGGPLLALVRNWFELLSTSGSAAVQTDILETCE